MACIKYIPLLFAVSTAHAQSFSDLFGQAGKQKNYYIQQIAAYHALQSEVKQGYGVMKHGLGGIRDINTAEMNAHSAYYTSLKTPSASVKSNSQVKAILNYQAYISAAFSQPFRGLTPDESEYVSAVKTNIFHDCNQDLSELQNLLGDGKLQMSDDERLKWLHQIHAAMLDKYQFSRSFTKSLKILAIRRLQETNHTNALNSLYENR